MAHKTTQNLIILVVSGFLFTLIPGCVKDTVKGTHSYTLMTPIYGPRADVMANMNGNPAETVKQAGKLYIKDNFIYLNEVDKGIHIIDNSNPSEPKQVAFLDIPGNLDIAVRDNILYADMWGDLIAMDISDPKNANIVKEIKDFFTMRMYVNGINTAGIPDQVIVGWIKKDTVVSIDDFNRGMCPNCLEGDVMLLQNAAYSSAAKSNGTAGSMASMVLINDYLYAIREPHSVGIVNVSTPSAPQAKDAFYAGFDLQTIYPFENKLFLGSMSGMYISDLSNPEAPAKLGEFSHGRACDPVVTDGDYAYVTLHAGSYCGGNANELNVVDVKNLMNPQLVKTYELTKPTGLCKDGNLLFVCDDISGVRVYDASQPDNLKQLAQVDSKEAYDVIAASNHAMVVGKDGLYQYDYSDLDNIRLLSFYSLKN